MARPRKLTLPPEEMINLGQEMIKWVEENNPIHLSQWYCIKKGYTDNEWDNIKVKEEFFPYYEHALKLVGYKYLTKDSPIDPSLKQRWQRVYFKDLRGQEDEDANAEADRKSRALKSEAKAQEQARQEVLDEVKRKSKPVKKI